MMHSIMTTIHTHTRIHIYPIGWAKLGYQQIMLSCLVSSHGLSFQTKVLFPVAPVYISQAELKDSKNVYLKKLLCIENIHQKLLHTSIAFPFPTTKVEISACYANAIGKVKQKGKHQLPFLIRQSWGKKGLSINRNLTSPSPPQQDTHISALKTVKSYPVPFLALQKLSCSSLTPGLRQLHVSTVAHGSLRFSLYRTGVSQWSSCGCLPGDTSLGFLFESSSHLL